MRLLPYIGLLAGLLLLTILLVWQGLAAVIELLLGFRLDPFAVAADFSTLFYSHYRVLAHAVSAGS